jgi:serine O-acetyltransferase
VFDLVRRDLRRFAPPPAGARALALRALLNPGSQALVVYRLGRWLRQAPARPGRWIPATLLVPLYAVAAAYVRAAYDIRLESSADVGAGLKIFHFGGIRLRRCRLGAGCVVHQRVEIRPDAPHGDGPEIGERVWIGPHARVLGPVRVGDGATIAAGALVTQDVAAGSLVAGDPARTTLIRYDNAALL